MFACVHMRAIASKNAFGFKGGEGGKGEEGGEGEGVGVTKAKAVMHCSIVHICVTRAFERASEISSFIFQ